ncbi:MAG: hypothetical protein Q9222_002927 [Ikaeria aurantiellina]
MNGHLSRNTPHATVGLESDKVTTQHGFRVTTRKLPILKAQPIERMTSDLGIAPPEMIFVLNSMRYTHFNGSTRRETQCSKLHIPKNGKAQGSSIRLVGYDVSLKVIREKKHEGITEVVKPFDWSYSTDYKGTENSDSLRLEPSQSVIPIELLKRPDPILLFDEVTLYEDEMADNGITLLSCKVRVMPARLLLLCRFFMRLDGVMIRIRDTRVYVEFSTNEVVREYTAREERYEVVRQKLAMKGLGLAPTFTTWSQITFLHMYILTVRLRAFPASHAPSWHQHLMDHFFYSAEERMVREHNIQARSIRNKYLKDLFVQWRGLMAGYDEGLVKGDAVLATAVWRNIFKGAEDVDLKGLGEVVSYMRGVLKGLDKMEDEEVADGEIQFGDPQTQRKVVEVRSKMMDTLPKDDVKT